MGAPKGQPLISDAERKKLEKFGRIVRKMREAKGWTQEDTETHGFKTWQHWSAIELGKKNINFTTILKVCKVLKVHPREIWDQM